MRNLRIRERDKMPVVFSAPQQAVIRDPYIERMTWLICVLRAHLSLTEQKLRIAHERLGWSA